ncbi:endolysin [Streptomyces phage Mischief19]|nr:endolysin [Streptomyces phage Mischief19]
MAQPMTADQFLAALKAEGCKVKEYPGWKTHNRNAKGAWGPLHGVMIHHTAGLNVKEFVHDGSAELPGPLCHGYIDKAGTVHLIGWGRANHAGGGDPDVLAAVKAETYPLPKTGEHQGSDGAVDGNPHFVGYECENKGDGKDPWPAVQLDAMVRATAAVLRYYDWSVNSAVRHLDWSDWKSDPKGVDWSAFRAAVTKRLDSKPTTPPADKPPTTPSKPQPTPAKPTVDLSKLIAAAKSDPAGPQGAAKYAAGTKLVEAALVELGYLDKRWADGKGSFGSKTVDAYRQLQRHLGYSGAAADGIPGRHSLTWLGLKTQNFTVVA